MINAGDESRSLTHISGITDISIPFHINMSELSMGDMYRSNNNNSAETSQKDEYHDNPVILSAQPPNTIPPPPDPSLPPTIVIDDCVVTTAALATPASSGLNGESAFSFSVKLTDQGLLVPLQSSTSSSPRENPRGADVSHEVIIAGTDNEDDTADDDNKDNVDDEEYNADDDEDDDDEEEEDDGTRQDMGGETFVHSSPLGQTPLPPVEGMVTISKGSKRHFVPLIQPLSSSRGITPEKMRADGDSPAEDSDPHSKNSFVYEEPEMRGVDPFPMSVNAAKAIGGTPSKESSLERSSGSTQPFVSGERGPDSDVEAKEDVEENLSVNGSAMSLSQESLPNVSMSVGANPSIDRRPSFMNILSEIYAMEEFLRRDEIPSVGADVNGSDDVGKNLNDPETANDEMQISLGDLFKDLPDIINVNFADELLKDVNQSSLPLLNQLDLDEILGSS